MYFISGTLYEYQFSNISVLSIQIFEEIVINKCTKLLLSLLFSLQRSLGY